MPARTPQRVLIVDDHHDTADTLAMLLELMGRTTLATYDGPEGLEAARSFHPDAALLDIGLPGMSGYELGQRLLDEHPLLRVIVISGFDGYEDFERSRHAGFHAYLPKPVDPLVLEEMLEGY